MNRDHLYFSDEKKRSAGGRLKPKISNSASRSQRIAIWFAACLILTFFLGFFTGEGKNGAANSDFYKYHLPAIKAFKGNQWSVVVRNYSSATTPLFHMLGSLNPLLGHDKAFRGSYMIFCLSIYFLFRSLLRARFSTIVGSEAWSWIIAGTLLISPYFRAQAFWPMTDNLALMFVILSGVLIEFLVPCNDYKLSDATTKLLVTCVPVTALCAFYTRQTYLFLSCYAIVFLWAKLPRSKFFLLSVVPLLIPAWYLFTIWHGLVPPSFEEKHEGFSFGGVLFPFVMVALYSVPFMLEVLLQEWRVVTHPNRKTLLKFAAVMACSLPFMMLFHPYVPTTYARSGGIVIKIFHSSGPDLGKALFLSSAYVGLVILYFLGRASSKYSNLLIALFMLSFVLLKVDFQRYFDPVLIVLFLSFMDRSVIKRFVTLRTATLVFGFEGILWLGEILHTHWPSII